MLDLSSIRIFKNLNKKHFELLDDRAAEYKMYTKYG